MTATNKVTFQEIFELKLRPEAMRKDTLKRTTTRNEETEMRTGETVLIPAALKQFSINPFVNSQLLEVYIK